jgi:hypothetical protein
MPNCTQLPKELTGGERAMSIVQNVHTHRKSTDCEDGHSKLIRNIHKAVRTAVRRGTHRVELGVFVRRVDIATDLQIGADCLLLTEGADAGGGVGTWAEGVGVGGGDLGAYG